MGGPVTVAMDTGCGGLSRGTTICVCYVLSYRAPDYIRTRSLLAALHQVPGLRVITASNTHCGIWRYFETWRALRQARSVDTPAVYILGFRGHEIFPWVRWVARSAPLVFDALMSPAAALKEEGKGGRLVRWLAPAARVLERYALRHSDALLTDTQLHADYFINTYGLRPDKVFDVPVGAVESPLIQPGARECQEAAADFTALFYGSFLPLHGVDVIIEAAARLTNLPIRFDFIGGRSLQEKYLRHTCARLGVTRYTYRRWVPFTRLLTEDIQRASVCLGGPFGGTPQARRVVTGKTSQCLALGKPTVIGKIDEEYGFQNRVNCMLVDQRDPAALAASLRWAYKHRLELAEIGRRGRLLYEARLSVRVIAGRLSRVLDTVVERTTL